MGKLECAGWFILIFVAAYAVGLSYLCIFVAAGGTYLINKLSTRRKAPAG